MELEKIIEEKESSRKLNKKKELCKKNYLKNVKQKKT